MIIASIPGFNHVSAQKSPIQTSTNGPVNIPLSAEKQQNEEPVRKPAPTQAPDKHHNNPTQQAKPPHEGQHPEHGAEIELTEAEQKQVQELKRRDREVRAHEQAHAAVAGSLAKGGPSYEYQRGPDGVRYAVGGHVGIDTSRVSGDPQATITKAQQIKRAALAPAQPSGTDRAVAARAAQMEARARVELAAQRAEELGNNEVNLTTGQQEEGAEEINSEQSSRTEHTDQLIETHSKCAVCGGHHSAESHVVMIQDQLHQVFTEHKSSSTSHNHDQSFHLTL